ncbi:hypothetical protein ILYODFUR_001493 [Ilyodon furcidens]|uniref:Uncharacterized protein n=1 Tax=Ilyodon furcidens TaxID=33524 RepID=A0ABV0TF75_9TELE
MPQTHFYSVLYIKTLNVGSLGPPPPPLLLPCFWPWGSWLDILAASIFAMLAAYSGSCVPETAPPDLLNSELFVRSKRADGRIVAPLERGAARHKLTMLNEQFFCFERGLKYKGFVLKK